jgi:hypothetical protein
MGLDIDRIVRVTGQALNKTSEAIVPGHQKDNALRMYENLKPEHFEALTDKYGDKTVEGYIKEMEARKLGVKD